MKSLIESTEIDVLVTAPRVGCRINPKITQRETQAWTIEIKGRYFVKFGKKDQVQTAWTMAGGKLFTCQGELKAVLDKLDTKKKKYILKLVEVEVQEHSGFKLRDYYSVSYQLRRMIRNAGAVGLMIGWHEMAKKISLMSAALVLMEKEFSNHQLEAISINVSKNTDLRDFNKVKDVWLLCTRRPRLDLRLGSFKREKRLEAIVRGDLEPCERNMGGIGVTILDWDIPF
ncbi:hypothetical protein [Vibrio pectenicida]|uniref:Uncharacterized protein n=1 Tax=Vibrio pectenicida TaxID=62763 RepID=A0A3R9EEA7_9VIBR|nr:hypothetical protein [Vibrio pectenicida]RSD31968.1 hypothetical protein EJA03_06270 [Vibrio pectenicida]